MFECVRFSHVGSGSCIGIATIHIPKWKATITGFVLHQKDGKRWVQLPCRKIEENGETKYPPTIWFDDKETKDKFCELVKDAIDQHAIKLENDNKNEALVQDEIPF